MKQQLRWIPAGVLTLLFATLWYLSTCGGQQGILAWLLLQEAVPYLGSLVLLGTMVRVLWQRHFTRAALVTTFIAVVTIWPFGWRIGLLPMAYPIGLETTTPAATVRLPSDAPLVVAWGGDTPRLNYHTIFPNARWAYDLMVEPAFTGSTQLTDYGCWGVPIVAPTAGEVVVAHDGEADVPIGHERAAGAPHQGNHIFMRIAGGTFLAIGHLQQHSLAVEVSDFVEEGELLGRCGNSGSSSEPHIHIHHQRQDPRQVPSELAEGLPLYFRNHDGPLMPTGGVQCAEQQWIGSGWIGDCTITLRGPIIQHIDD